MVVRIPKSWHGGGLYSAFQTSQILPNIAPPIAPLPNIITSINIKSPDRSEVVRKAGVAIARRLSSVRSPVILLKGLRLYLIALRFNVIELADLIWCPERNNNPPPSKLPQNNTLPNDHDLSEPLHQHWYHHFSYLPNYYQNIAVFVCMDLNWDCIRHKTRPNNKLLPNQQINKSNRGPMI